MNTTLITGASGFIGRSVVAAVDTSRGDWHASGRGVRPADLPAAIQWHALDLMNGVAVDTLMEQLRPTHLLHLAWMPTAGGRYWSARENVDWVAASLHLVRRFVACGGTRIVAAGTCAEYAWTTPRLSEATTPLVPATPYGRCRGALHTLLQEYCELSRVEYAWGRIFYVFGPEDAPSRLVGSILHALADGRIAECGDGDVARDFLHVEDVASAFLHLLSSPLCGAVNIGSGVATTVRDIAERIAIRMGQPGRVEFGRRPRAEGDPDVIVADTSRLRTTWRPRYDISDGIDATVDAFLRARGASSRASGR